MVVQTMVTILFLLSSPFIVLANVLIVSAWFRFKRLQTPSNALIVSLAASDLGFGLSLPIVIIYQSLIKKQDYHSSFTSLDSLSMTMTMTTVSNFNLTTITTTDEESSGHSVDSFQQFPIRPCAILLTFSVSSLVTIGAIALDRFTSVAQPLRYNHYVTYSYVQRFLLVTWLGAITIGIIPFLDWFDPPGHDFGGGGGGRGESLERSKEFISWLGLLIYMPCVLCAVLAYSYIYMVARGHSRAIYMVEVSLNHGDVCHLSDSSIHHHRYGLTLTFLLTIFILSWTPIVAASFLDHFAHMTILDDGQWRAALLVPTILSPLLNPLLYGFRSSEIRICAVRIVDAILTRLTGRPRTIDIFHSLQPKGELTSCASNVRLLAVSPTQTQTTVHCCPMTPIPTNESRNHLQILLCDQTSL